MNLSMYNKDGVTGIILRMGSANDRRHIVTQSLIGRAHTQNDPCVMFPFPPQEELQTRHTLRPDFIEIWIKM